MKIIVAVAIAAIAWAAPTAAQAAGNPWCGRLQVQHAYAYTYQGATIKVPPGRVLLYELRADGVSGKQLNTACRVLVHEYRTRTR